MLNLLLNILFAVLGGFAIAIEYITGGLLLCLTIVGIPFGIQSFKIGMAALLPFGSKVVSVPQSVGMGCVAFFCNVLWVITAGWIIALTHLALGCLWCITIIGIPLGVQHFKLMRLAFAPFGKAFVAA